MVLIDKGLAHFLLPIILLGLQSPTLVYSPYCKEEKKSLDNWEHVKYILESMQLLEFNI